MDDFKVTMNPIILDAAGKFLEALNGQPYVECVHIFASMIATMIEMDNGDLSPEEFALDVYKDITKLKEE